MCEFPKLKSEERTEWTSPTTIHLRLRISLIISADRGLNGSPWANGWVH